MEYKTKSCVRASEHEGNVGTFAEAAKFGEVVFSCTHSLEVLRYIDRKDLSGN
jgi:hypothetical protein